MEGIESFHLTPSVDRREWSRKDMVTGFQLIIWYGSGNGGTHVTGELLPFHFCRSCLSFLARDASHFQASHVRRARSSCHSLLHILRDVDRSLRATEGRRRSVSDDRPRLTRFLCHLVSPLPLVTGALLPHCVRPKGPPRYARFRRW